MTQELLVGQGLLIVEDPRPHLDTSHTVVEWKRDVMAHAQKPDSVFQRNGRVHLYRRGCQFSRVLGFLEWGSGENDCSNTGRTVPSQTENYWLPTPFAFFPLHFSSRASPCAIRFRFHSTPQDEWPARRRDLYLTAHNIHMRQLSMLPVGFEPTIPASERPQTSLPLGSASC